jgi:mRNA interferase RelE/StbE
MSYGLYITSAAYRQLKKLDRNVQVLIRERLDHLCKDPYGDELDVKKLQGCEGYRLRIGDYRIIYRLKNSDLIVEVLAIGHRKEIY